MGLSVGLIKGGLWLMCWVGAIFATLYGYPYLEPAAAGLLMNRNIITNKWLADMAVGAGIFIVSLIFLFMASSMVTGWVRTSRMNALDRSLGFLAGIFAGVLIVSAVYIPFSSMWADKPEDQPSIVREARLRPLVEWASSIVASLLPQALAEKIPSADHGSGANGADKDFQALAAPPQPSAKTGSQEGYNSQQRSDMDRLLQTTGSH